MHRRSCKAGTKTEWRYSTITVTTLFLEHLASWSTPDFLTEAEDENAR